MIRLMLILIGLCGHTVLAFPDGKWALDPYWLRLLHYKANIFGLERSLIDSPGFFFAPTGRVDPLAEWNETIKAFRQREYSEGDLVNRHPQCRFPERFRYLVSKGVEFAFHVNCPDFSEWKSALDVGSATLIFASAYAHTPASLFGHTFLRLNSRSKKGIRDYGANFSAITADDNLIAYAFKGVFGGYSGVFSVSPYYEKLNEYIYVENRDIWEYELELDAEALDRLVNHLWELYANATFDYYYFDENCSYQLLGLLEVARSDWSLTDFSLYVTPLETLRRVRDAGGLRQKTYRPSAQRTLQARVDALLPGEKSNFQALIKKDLGPEPSLGAKALDAASAYFIHKKLANKGRLPPPETEWMHRLLVARSQVEENSKPVEVVAAKSPESGHPPYRLSLGFIRAGAKNEIEFGGRVGVHDLLNGDAGYSPFTEFKILDMRWRYEAKEKQPFLSGLELFQVTSITPITETDKIPSYQLEVQYQDTQERDCPSRTCLAPSVGGGLGPAMAIYGSSVVSWLMARAEWRGPSRSTGETLSAGGEWSVLSRWGDRQKALLNLEVMKRFHAGRTSDWISRHSATYSLSLTENHELRARLKWGSLAPTEAILEWGYFF